MCLHPRPVDPIPDDTVRVAKAAFRKPTICMRMRDEFGVMLEDGAFSELYPKRGQPGFSPWRLALVTIMQFVENLSDRQAADAVRGRLDWKYCLSLELTDPGFDSSVLCEFRTRLLEGGADETIFETLLERFRHTRLLKAQGRQRTDSTHVLAAVRDLSRLELVGESLRLALNALATAVPDWLATNARSEWAGRYSLPINERRLPRGKDNRRMEAERIGEDGFELLAAICGREAPAWLRELPAIETLRRVWVQNYLITPKGTSWRTKEDGLPPTAPRIYSPRDLEARSMRKRSTAWLGYTVHLTETCEYDLPSLITHVETTPASATDTEALGPIHESLSARNLLPAKNIVDMGYTDSRFILDLRDTYGVDLFGPVRGDYGRHAKEQTGFEVANFHVHWDKEEAICPEGKKSNGWSHTLRHNKPVISITFSEKDCGACPSQELCTGSTKGRDSKGRMRNPKRTIVVVSKEQQETLDMARQRQITESFEQEYRYREGIEGTVSRAVRAHGLRRAPYRGLERVHLGHALTAAAVNFARVAEWMSDMPRPPASRSPFSRLFAS